MDNFRVKELQVSGLKGDVDPASQGTPSATETMSTEWTDEKHSKYLKSMEASFVNQLYSSMDSRGWNTHTGTLSHIKSSKPRQFNPRASSGLFKVLRAGFWQNINYGRGEGEGDNNKLDSDLLANPWFLHYRSAGKPRDAESPIARGNDVCDEVDSSLMKETTSVLPVPCSKQFNVSHSYLLHQDMVGGNTEVSDQNFADEEIKEEKSITSGNCKRVKSLKLQASNNDQVVPFRKPADTEDR